jgi:hypothetical protein
MTRHVRHTRHVRRPSAALLVALAAPSFVGWACAGWGDDASHPDRPHREARAEPTPDGNANGKRRSPEDIPRDKPETVVFVVMDTVRADHLSLCGYARPTSPFLEHMRDEFGAAWSCDAYSPATWTMPSHTSYFTGTGLPEHKHDRLGGTLPDTTGPMLSEQMKAKGFVTMMFAANTALQKSGLQRGFDHVRIARDMTELREPNFAAELERALGKADASKPWFLFVNLIDAHDPYPKVPEGVSWVEAQDAIPFDVRKPEADTPYHDFLRGEMPPAQAERFLADVRDGYDWGVSREDEDVRHVLTVLRKLGRLPGPLRIVVTADHGEFLGEHGLLRHAAYTWEPVVKVPFLYFDNLASTQITLPSPMSATTAYHLVLHGALPEPALPVVSWSRVMDDRPVKPGEDMLAEWHAGAPKLLWWDGKTMSFDLATDPGEERPVEPAVATPAHRADLDARVATYRAHLDASSKLPLDPETVESLRKLGYLTGSEAP